MSFFAGRGTELDDLREFIQPESPYNVIFVTGVSGVGKTRLVDHMMHDVKEPSSPEFRQARLSVEGGGWIFIVTGLLREMLSQAGLGREPLMANMEELEQLIIEHATAEPYLLTVDDLPGVEDNLLRFSASFASARPSRLIVITRDAPHDHPPNVKVLHVERLSDEDSRRLLHGDLERLIERTGEWNLIRQLEGNPHKLMMLRGFRPTTAEGLRDAVRALVDPSINELTEVVGEYEHFAALGCLRHPVFEEDLLAFLWDRLGDGGTEPYVRARQDLMDRWLLIRPDPGESRLRINGGAHQQLQALSNEPGREAQSHYFHYFLAVYHRNRFSKAKGEPSMHHLENYAYHATQAGQVESAFRYLFDGVVLQTAFRRDLSLQLRPVLQQLEKGLTLILTGQPSPAAGAMDPVELKLATVKMELGRIYKDLNDPENGIRLLADARMLVSDIRGLERDRLAARINHFRGIAHSVLGQEQECRDAYEESFLAARDIPPEPLDALTLGYLAYETKFNDLDRAGKLARLAVDVSHHLGDDETKMKNLCSLGQILSFACRFEESQKAFDDAQAIQFENVRELCRIKVNAMVTAIGKGNHVRATRLLREAQESFGKTGDRRRLAMGLAYQGIMEFKSGRKEEGKQLVLDALRKHREGGARREALYEALTWRWMGGDARGAPHWVADVLETGENERMAVYREFWERCYKPALLESPPDTRWGVVFDMDGVVADTNPKHRMAIKELCSRYGKEVDEEMLRTHVYGQPGRAWIPRVFGPETTPERVEDLSNEKEKIFREAWGGSVEPLNGLADLLTELKEAGVPLAIASSAPRANIDFVLEKTNLAEVFPVILDEHSVVLGKPNPDVFIAAAAMLELHPGRCAVFEDSLSGIEAGHEAGCKVIGVATTHSEDEIRTNTGDVIASFEGYTLANLAAHFE